MSALDKPAKDSRKRKEPVETAVQNDGNLSAGRRAKRPRTSNEPAHLALEPSKPGAEDTVEVLSRKDLRKKKKEHAKVPEAPPQKVVNTGRSQHGVWIGNLAFATDVEKLGSFLIAGGCTAPTRFNMPGGKRPHEKNRGFAYVDFADEPSAKVAVTLSEGHLDGRKLLIKLNNDFVGRPTGAASSVGLSKTAKKIADRQKNLPAPTLFLGNLGFEVTEDRIRHMFEGNHLAAQRWLPKNKRADMAKSIQSSVAVPGEANDRTDPKDELRISVGIRKVRMGTFEDSGKCKGWAFVDFHTTEQATNALLNSQNHHLDTRDIVVEYATPDAVRRGGGNASNGRNGMERRNPGLRPMRPHVERTHIEAPTETLAEDLQVKPIELPPAVKANRPRGKGKLPKVRAKSGATLAKAQRAKTGIVLGAPVGKKTVFS